VVVVGRGVRFGATSLAHIVLGVDINVMKREERGEKEKKKKKQQQQETMKMVGDWT